MVSKGTAEILEKVQEILKNEKLRVTLTQSGKAGLISGLCTMAGGLLGGRTGTTIGGVTGTLLNHFLTRDIEFVSLVHVIKNELSDEEKTSLAELLQDGTQLANSSNVVNTVVKYVNGLGYETIDRI